MGLGREGMHEGEQARMLWRQAKVGPCVFLLFRATDPSSRPCVPTSVTGSLHFDLGLGACYQWQSYSLLVDGTLGIMGEVKE